jgi:hypothetical protein
MKFNLILLALAGLVFSSCSQKATEAEATADGTVSADTLKTFVNWPEVGIHETPAEKGKYLTSVYMGEQLTVMGDTATEKSGDRTYHYHKVQLSDGKQGWVRDEFIAINSSPAACIAATQIFKRPDIAAVTGKEFAMVDFVAAKPSEGNWIEVTGRITGEKWFTTGYVQKSSLTFDPVDVEFAALNGRRNQSTNEKLAETLLRQMQSAPFPGTLFYNALFEEVESNDGGGEGGDGGVDPLNAESVFQSQNYPTHFMTVVNNYGELSELDDAMDTPEAAFHVWRGRSPNCVDCVVLESSSFPGNYLCATTVGQEIRMTLVNLSAVADDKQALYQDAMSFRTVPGLANPQAISFSAFIHPGNGDYYIRHSNFHLYLNPNDGSDIFRQDATFTQLTK